MPSIYIKNAKNKMKRYKREKKNKEKKEIQSNEYSTKDTIIKEGITDIDSSVHIPTHDEAVSAAVEIAKKHLNL